MEIAKYRAAEIIPLVITVLDLTAYFYSGIAFKYAVKDHYQDLKYQVSTNDINPENLELLRTIDDQLIIRIGGVVSHITTTIKSIGGIYNIDFDNFWDDEDILVLAEDFYWAFMEDHFPDEGEEDLIDDESYAHGLDIYVSSLIRIMNRLVNVVATGEVNFARTYEIEEHAEGFQLPNTQGYEHSAVLNLLTDLGIVIANHQQFVVEQYLNPNMAPKPFEDDAE